MSTRYFTQEELEVIRSNPNVDHASEKSIKFTKEFKQKAYNELIAGNDILDIFRSAGFDVVMLGMYRIRAFKEKLLFQSKREAGFDDLRINNYRRPAKTGEETVETRVRQLEHELAYTRQEVEFLKKLRMADMEAQRQWESKHLQK